MTKIQKKKIDRTDIIMLLVIFFLGILIIGLGIRIGYQEKHKKEPAHLIIQLIEEGTNYAFQITLNDIKENEEYTFKVTNYKDEEINKNKLSYTIKIGNETDSVYKLYKNNELTNLSTTDNISYLENNKLKIKTKQTDEYKLIVTEKKNIEEDSKLVINVQS